MTELGRVAVRRLGAGPDVVLLHGLLGLGAQWLGCAELFGKEFTCWILELPGIGTSESNGDYTLAGLRRWLELALEALELPRFCLVGSSWGGALALEFAAHSPLRGRLRRQVLAAPAHPLWTPNQRQRWLLTPPWTRWVARLGAHVSLTVQREALARMFGDRARMPPESAANYRWVLRRPGLGRALEGYARDWRGDQERLRAALPNVAAPTLLVWGTRDLAVPAATAAGLHDALPHARLELLPGLGHLPFEEDPAAFARLAAPFLAEA